ncbi:MAG: hypothetical protein HKN03_09080 [Acidimicrobiales bacterium]|nr:hypothetical protein [Acidimicrobiales bacterium]
MSTSNNLKEAMTGSRVALAVVLSILSVAAIAGPLAYQAIEVRDQIDFGPAGRGSLATVGGLTTVKTEPVATTTSAVEVDDTEPSDDPVVDEAPPEKAPTGTQPPAPPSPAPSTAATAALPEPSLSSSPPSIVRESTSTSAPVGSGISSIPASPGAPPTWAGSDGDALESSAPTTTAPNNSASSGSAPVTTAASTSGSVTTQPPQNTTITDPLEPIDSTTSTSAPITTTAPPTTDPVVTDPLLPIETTEVPVENPPTTVPTTNEASESSTTAPQADPDETLPPPTLAP